MVKRLCNIQSVHRIGIAGKKKSRPGADSFEMVDSYLAFGALAGLGVDGGFHGLELGLGFFLHLGQVFR